MITLAQTAILLTAAVVAVSLFRFLRLSSILGYVAAGLAIGPWGLNLIGDVARISQVSEFGIVLLLFVIGLELQPTRLWVMRRTVFGLGSAQVLLCTLALGAAAYGLGQPPVTAAIIGFGLSLSSTPARAAGAGRAQAAADAARPRRLRHPPLPGPRGAAGAGDPAAALGRGERARGRQPLVGRTAEACGRAGVRDHRRRRASSCARRCAWWRARR